MELVNFGPELDPRGIKAHGIRWHLHTDFRCVRHNGWTATVELEVRREAQISKNPDVPLFPTNHFRILFHEVDYLEVTPGDPPVPFGLGHAEDARLEMEL